jgi:hypothetical protein
VRYVATFLNRRNVRLTVHQAVHLGLQRNCYFLTVTNLSRDRDVEITHVWFATTPEVHVLQAERPLPARLNPDQSWETWVEADQVPSQVPDAYSLGRVRLSSHKIITSHENENVPPYGAIPGGSKETDMQPIPRVPNTDPEVSFRLAVRRVLRIFHTYEREWGPTHPQIRAALETLDFWQGQCDDKENEAAGRASRSNKEADEALAVEGEAT